MGFSLLVSDRAAKIYRGRPFRKDLLNFCRPVSNQVVIQRSLSFRAKRGISLSGHHVNSKRNSSLRSAGMTAAECIVCGGWGPSIRAFAIRAENQQAGSLFYWLPRTALAMASAFRSSLSASALFPMASRIRPRVTREIGRFGATAMASSASASASSNF